MSNGKNNKSLFKPSYLFWIFSIAIFVFLYIEIDKEFELSSKHYNTTEIHYADAITEAHLSLIEKFNKKYEGRIKVIPIDLPFEKFSTNERKELLARSLRSKSEKIDLFAVDIVWGYRFAKWAENLSSYFDHGFLEKIIDPIFPTCYYNDSLFAFPFTIDLGTMYYRDDKLAMLPGYEKLKQRLQESITWEELIELGLKTRTDGNPFYLYPASDYEGLICSFTELLLNQNRTFFENNSIDLNRPEAHKALRTMYDLIYKYELTPEIVTAFTEYQCHKYFIEKEGYFVRSWPTFFSENIEGLNDELKSNIKRVPLPHFKGTKPAAVFGGWNLVVSKFSEHKPEVIEFIKFLLTHESQKELFELNGSLPVLSSVYEDPSVKNAEVLDFYFEQYNYGVHRPLLEDYTRISDIISYFVHKVLSQAIEIDKALSEATRMINSNEVIFK